MLRHTRLLLPVIESSEVLSVSVEATDSGYDSPVTTVNGLGLSILPFLIFY